MGDEKVFSPAERIQNREPSDITAFITYRPNEPAKGWIEHVVRETVESIIVEKFKTIFEEVSNDKIYTD